MKVIIIGAGLAGLGAGLELQRQGIDFEVLEATDSPGGLAKTDVLGDFYFDYTGHYLHVKTEEGFKDLIEDTVPFTRIKKESAVLVANKIVPYPIQYNLKHLDSDTITNITNEVEGLQNMPKASGNTLTEFLEEHFGHTLVNLFFKPYNEKLWGKSLNLLPKNCLGNYFPKIDLSLLLEGCTRETVYAGYNDYFYYPESGKIGSMCDALALRINQNIRYSTKVTEIDYQDKKCYDSNGNEYTYDHLITSLPLNKIYETVSANADNHSLHYTSLKNVRLVIEGEMLHSYHWLYIADPEVPFYRIGFTQNVSTETCPPGFVNISIEIEITNKDYSDQEISELAIKYLTDYGLIRYQGIHLITSTVISPAYTYSGGPSQELDKYFNFLKRNNIHSIGRYGLWKYFSMEEAYLSGKHLIKNVINQPHEEFRQKAGAVG